MRRAMERREQKQQRCQDDEARAGDRGDHTAGTADSKGVMSLGVGQRTPEQTPIWGQDAQRRLRPGPLPAIFTEPMGGMSRLSWRPLDGAPLAQDPGKGAAPPARRCAGLKSWRMVREKRSRQDSGVNGSSAG